MNLGSILGVIGSLFAVVLVVATVVAYFRASLAKATIDTLRDSNNALQERVTILESETEKMKVKTESLQRENGILREAVSGKADILQIVQLLENHHNTVMDRKAVLDRKVDDILGILQDRRGQR